MCWAKDASVTRRAATGNTLRKLASRLEASDALEAPAGTLQSLATRLDRGLLGGFLRGQWLGHSLHPLLTDFPLGAWACTSLLDLFGGDEGRKPAEFLLSFGLLAAVPTAAAGLAEWSGTSNGSRRVGVAHAATNTAALITYFLSLAARRRGRRRTAVGLSVLGGVVATCGGYLGGHLSLVLGVGVEGAEKGRSAETDIA